MEMDADAYVASYMTDEQCEEYNELEEMKFRRRRWFLTINNFEPNDISFAKGLLCSYCLIGEEYGKEKGTHHIHIYLEFKETKSFSKMKKLFPRANIQEAKGNAAQVKVYLSKEKLIYEEGTPKKQGQRTDLEHAKDVLEETGKISEVVKVATSYQSVRMCECYLKYHEKKRNWKPLVEWFYGSTGTGKSKSAYEILGEEAYTAGKSIKWWEGYDGHEGVVIDDFRKDFCCFHELLKLIDRYPYKVECKGGSREFLAKHIIITSAYSPSETYETREDIKQLLRRIDNIKIFTNSIKENGETDNQTNN